MKKHYEILEWDSNFFGFPVCRIDDAVSGAAELEETLHSISQVNITLAYYSSRKALTSLDKLSALFEIKLVDRKTTYFKEVNPALAFHQNITKYKEAPNNKLLDLAIESGAYSRFNIDSRIGKDKFEELYSLWIINSVNRKIAKEVLVYLDSNEIAGFVTLGEKSKRGDIGIIAVDAKFRGRGIGKSLVTSAESCFAGQGYGSVQVVTQGDNVPACRLYESCGYSADTVGYFYHLWRK